MDEQLGFNVSTFVELPIIPQGMKAVQKRDAKGRFTSDWDIVPDPDAKSFPTEVGNVYLINNTFDKIWSGCSLCGPHFIGRCPHVVPSYPSLKALEPSFTPLREAHCCKTCKRCAITDEGRCEYLCDECNKKRREKMK